MLPPLVGYNTVVPLVGADISSFFTSLAALAAHHTVNDQMLMEADNSGKTKVKIIVVYQINFYNLLNMYVRHEYFTMARQMNIKIYEGGEDHSPQENIVCKQKPLKCPD